MFRLKGQYVTNEKGKVLEVVGGIDSEKQKHWSQQQKQQDPPTMGYCIRRSMEGRTNQRLIQQEIRSLC